MVLMLVVVMNISSIYVNSIEISVLVVFIINIIV